MKKPGGITVLTKAQRVIAATLTISATIVGVVTPASAQSLPEALKHAYRNQPVLDAARAEQRATDELRPQAFANWRPTVVTEATARHEWSNEDKLRFENSKPLNFKIRLRQPIFRGYRTVSEIKRADQLIAAGRQQLVEIEQAVMFDAIQAYMDVIRDREILRLRRNQVVLLRHELKGNRRRLELGMVTRTDVAQASARLSSAIANVRGAEANLSVSVTAYIRYVGRKPGVLTRPPLSPRLPKTLEKAIKLADQYNPEIIGAMHKEVAARHFINVKRGELLPTVSLEAEYTHASDMRHKFGDEEVGVVRGRLTVPIYQGGGVYSKVRAARQQANRRRMLILAARRKVRQQVGRLWNRYRETDAKIAAIKQQIGASMVAVEGVRKEALLGSRTTQEVLDAERELMNARIRLEEMRRNRIVKSYEVIASTGRLTARDLGLSIAYYDPHEYHDRVKFRRFGADIRE